MAKSKLETKVSFEPFSIKYYVDGKKVTKEEYAKVAWQRVIQSFEKK